MKSQCLKNSSLDFLFSN